jgi:murein DD-endopeptidase MepM/ murein hydrolase activator NlpD
MMMPFKSGFRVSSPYGLRADPLTGERSWHSGIDLVGADRDVLAVVGGSVLKSRIVTDKTDATWEWGNYVSVFGDDGRIYYYCHLAERTAEAGGRVEAGQRVGIEGATGRVTGVHLHFEVRNPSNYGTQDPAEILGIPNEGGYVWKPIAPYIEQASSWAVDAVAWAIEKGILKGRGGDDYALREPITREEMCVMIYRCREVL